MSENMAFKQSESIKTILPLMIEVQSEVPQLSKDRDNPHAKSRYVTLDNILGNVLPILNSKGVLLQQIPVEEKDENGHRIGVKTIFLHKSGEYMEYPPVFYEFEKGGRMNNTQSVGSIISYARRYAITSILALSTAEDDDGVGSGKHVSGGYQHNIPPAEPEIILVNQGDIKKINEKIVILAGLYKGNLKENREKITRKIAGQAQVSNVNEIPKEYLGSLLEMLDRMIANENEKNQPVQPQQTSLMEGSTTKARE